MNKILIWILIILLSIISIQYIQNKLLNTKVEKITLLYQNKTAESDTLKLISSGLYEKLSFISNEKILIEKEKEILNKKLSGTTIEINNLKFKIKELNGKLNNIVGILDTVYIEGNKKLKINYPFEYKQKEYSLNGNINLLSDSKPDSLNMNYNINFKPINIAIITKENIDKSYSIYVKSESNLFTLINNESYILNPKVSTPFYKRINPGIGFSVDDKGNANIFSGIKYENNLINIIYAQNKFGLSYQYFIRKN